MRISVDRNDPSYDIAKASRYRVALNGRHVLYVITADDVEGMVLSLACDESGHPQTDPSNPFSAVAVVRAGDVEFKAQH